MPVQPPGAGDVESKESALRWLEVQLSWEVRLAGLRRAAGGRTTELAARRKQFDRATGGADRLRAAS